MENLAAVRLGVVGLGNIAKQHIQHLRGADTIFCELAATCSRSTSSETMQYSQSLGVPHFHDYRELIDSGLCDAIIVATPTFTHSDIGAYVLKAGLHLLMEKPLGLCVESAQSLLAQQHKDKVFALMLNQRTDPVFLKMHEIIEAGALGKITRTHWTMTHWFRPEIYFQVSDWRATWRGEGGGLLVNQCIHNLDIFQWLCGMPASVHAHCQFGKYHDIEVEDEVTAYFEYASGATGVFVASTGEAPGVNRLDIIGDAGSLHFDGEHLLHSENKPTTSAYSRSSQDMFGMPETTTRDITPLREVNQHAQIISNFAAAIRKDKPLIAPAKQGINSLALANAMLQSTWQGSAVSLPLDSALYQQQLNERIAGSTLREKSDLAVNIDMSTSYR